jgi:hypothetical protein
MIRMKAPEPPRDGKNIIRNGDKPVSARQTSKSVM